MQREQPIKGTRVTVQGKQPQHEFITIKMQGRPERKQEEEADEVVWVVSCKAEIPVKETEVYSEGYLEQFEVFELKKSK